MAWQSAKWGGKLTLKSTEDYTYYPLSGVADAYGSIFFIAVADFLPPNSWIQIGDCVGVFGTEEPYFYPSVYYFWPMKRRQFKPILASQEYFDEQVQKGNVDLTQPQKGHGDFTDFAIAVFSTDITVPYGDVAPYIPR